MDLIQAAQEGSEQTVRLLLASTENPRHVGVNGSTALMWAAYQGHEQIVRLLLNTDESRPGHQNEEGVTALILAARHGHEQIVRLLLATNESNPGHRNNFGSTALMRAAQEGHEQIVRLLLASGESNPGNRNKRGSTAWSLSNKPISRLVLIHLVLDALNFRRYQQYKVIRRWSSLEGLNSPRSNQMFYDMGTQLRQPRTFEVLKEEIPDANMQNHKWYMIGVNI